jgi:hypothetical protein
MMSALLSYDQLVNLWTVIKEISKRGLTDHRISSWQGWQNEYRTFEDDIELNVDEVRQLLDLSDDCGEAAKV